MKTCPSIEKSSLGWPSNPPAVPRPHNVRAAASACATGSIRGPVADVLSAVLATSVSAGQINGISNALCAKTSAPDTRRNCTGARNEPTCTACGVAACAR